MSADELHRVLNLIGLLTLLFFWTWSLATHRRTFSRRQVVVSAALIPFFATIGHSTYRAWQNHFPITVDTWSLSVSIGILLAAMAAPSHWYHDRDKPPSEGSDNG